jgi:acetolactate synthase-1/2/3 large subunit
VIRQLWHATNEREPIIVTDVGQHQMWESQYFTHDRSNMLLTSGGLGTMGYALPAAIGAQMANRDRLVWAVAGDGGFQMTLQELAVLKQEHDLPVKIAIINNGFLGMVRQWQEFFFGGRYVATPLLSPDFVKIAEAHSLTGIRVEQRSEVEEAVRMAEATEGTVVIDFRVEQEDAVYPMVPAGANLHDMIERPAAANQDHNPIFETGEDE